MSSLTSFVVIYHEEEVLERCLESVASISDEIIVIHDGPCQDRSLDIARKYTDNVIVAERTGFGEFHRVKAMSLASSEWILQLDADEFLSEEAQKKIPELIKDPKIDGYKLLWKLWDGAKYISNETPHKSVLFRKSKMYYISFPGTEMSSYGKVKSTQLHLEHRPTYNNYTLKVFYSKWIKWIKIHASFMGKSNIEHFNADTATLSAVKEKMTKHIKYSGVFFSPAWFAMSTFKALFKHKYYRNVSGWKVSFLQGLYAFYLCLFIARENK